MSMKQHAIGITFMLLASALSAVLTTLLAPTVAPMDARNPGGSRSLATQSPLCASTQAYARAPELDCGKGTLGGREGPWQIRPTTTYVAPDGAAFALKKLSLRSSADANNEVWNVLTAGNHFPLDPTPPPRNSGLMSHTLVLDELQLGYLGFDCGFVSSSGARIWTVGNDVYVLVGPSVDRVAHFYRSNPDQLW
jgi:hypothetical protein